MKTRNADHEPQPSNSQPTIKALTLVVLAGLGVASFLGLQNSLDGSADGHSPSALEEESCILPSPSERMLLWSYAFELVKGEVDATYFAEVIQNNNTTITDNVVYPEFISYSLWGDDAKEYCVMLTTNE